MIFQTRAKLIKNIEVVPSYYKMTLEAREIAKSALPGQFVTIRVSDNYEPLLRRPFSIHRVRSQKSEVRTQIEILYEVKGRGTEILAEKKAGEYLDVLGPLGSGFDYSAPVRQCTSAPVLVAGGMGVAPLIFLAEKLAERKAQSAKHKALILIGAKTKSQILCEKKFRDLGCEVKIATDDGSRGFKGKVTELLNRILRTTHNAQRTTLYACGPRPMLKEIAKISQRHNIPAQISLEEHMACGIGACLGCVIKTQNAKRPPKARLAKGGKAQSKIEYKRVCKEGPVFMANQIIW